MRRLRRATVPALLVTTLTTLTTLVPGPAPAPVLGKLTPVTDADVDCLAQRHLFLKENRSWDLKDRTIGAGQRCRHGWPQVLVMDPIWPGHRLGDVVRLTCPLLVSAIDRYEKQGALRGYNSRVAKDPAWRSQLYASHVAQRDLRQELLSKAPEEEMAKVRKTMGNATVELVMDTGIANMRFDANCSDVKCLHAHVGDELSRGGNAIGRQVLEDLVTAGVEIEGTDQCCDHCNVKMPLSEARWTLQLAKNKLGQRLRRARRREGVLDPPGGPVNQRLPVNQRMPPKNSYFTSR